MYMLKCLVKLQNCVIRDVYCNPNSTIPMPFATVEDASKFACENLLNKKFENIGNETSIFAFQPIPYSPKPQESELVR